MPVGHPHDSQPAAGLSPLHWRRIKITNRSINRKTVGIIALLLGVICWGLTPVLLRRLTPFIDAWTANGLRYPMAALLYWPLLVIAFRDGRVDVALIRRCLPPAIFALGGQVFWALSHYELQATEVGFIVRLSTLWAIVGAMFLFRDERKLLKKPSFYLGVLLLVGGFLAMALLGPQEIDTTSAVEMTETARQLSNDARVEIGRNYGLGMTYIVLCGLFFGFYVVSVRRFMPDVDPVLAFAVVGNVVSVGTIVGMCLKGDIALIWEQTLFSWSLLAGSSFLGIALGHILMYLAVQRLGAAITSGCQTLMPFITAAVASVTLGEVLTSLQWGGGFIMVVGAATLLSLRHVISDAPNDDT